MAKKPVINFEPRTETQREYLKALTTHSMTIATGPAGTGKTFVAANFAAGFLPDKRVILSRPTVPIDGENIGFLPGSLEKKMEPWTAPIMEIFKKQLGVPRTLDYLKDGTIQIVPFAFMRGRTFENAVVLVDEAQNMTPNQAQALVTRIGERCTYILTGDLDQCDNDSSGLGMLIWMIEKQKLPVPVIKFKDSEVVRSRMCRIWVNAFRAIEEAGHPEDRPTYH
jgi:phosphate starvation-inducible protein PhoH and related proteins